MKQRQRKRRLARVRLMNTSRFTPFMAWAYWDEFMRNG